MSTPGGKKIEVTQTRSTIRRCKKQLATLRGLGLGRIGRRKTLVNQPSVLGMIRTVSHLVEVREID